MVKSMQECYYCGQFTHLARVPSFNLAMCKDCWEALQEMAGEAIECIESVEKEENEIPHIHEHFFK
jgi:hypothetical protein